MASQASPRGGWLASVACSDVRHRTHILCMYLLSGFRSEDNTLLNVPTASSSAYQSVPRGGCPGSEAALLPGSPHGCHKYTDEEIISYSQQYLIQSSVTERGAAYFLNSLTSVLSIFCGHPSRT